MQNFKSFSILFLLIGATELLNAADFEEGVPLELVERFTNGQISSDLPVDFPAIDLPDSVTIMGSLDNSFSQMIVFSSTLPADQAGMELAESFMDAGWIRLLSMTYEQPERGFVYPNPSPLPLTADDQFCDDRVGTMTISLPQDTENIISLRLNNQALMQPGFSCRQQNEQRQMQRDRGIGFPFSMQNNEYMPRLVLPEDENQEARPQRPFFGNFSGSSNDIETQGSFMGDWDISELNTHFAEQLEEQGWQLDSDWTGEFSAGGNWELSPQPDQEYIGIFSILERIEGVFDLKFRMIFRNASPGSADAIGVSSQRIFRQ